MRTWTWTATATRRSIVPCRARRAAAARSRSACSGSHSSASRPDACAAPLDAVTKTDETVVLGVRDVARATSRRHRGERVEDVTHAARPREIPELRRLRHHTHADGLWIGRALRKPGPKALAKQPGDDGRLALDLRCTGDRHEAMFAL